MAKAGGSLPRGILRIPGWNQKMGHSTTRMMAPRCLRDHFGVARAHADWKSCQRETGHPHNELRRVHFASAPTAQSA